MYLGKRGVGEELGRMEGREVAVKDILYKKKINKNLKKMKFTGV